MEPRNGVVVGIQTCCTSRHRRHRRLGEIRLQHHPIDLRHEIIPRTFWILTTHATTNGRGTGKQTYNRVARVACL
eukprot:scaffold3337_cov169-Amphora_coffeaeformis.AAC.22